MRTSTHAYFISVHTHTYILIIGHLQNNFAWTRSFDKDYTFKRINLNPKVYRSLNGFECRGLVAYNLKDIFYVIILYQPTSGTEHFNNNNILPIQIGLGSKAIRVKSTVSSPVASRIHSCTQTWIFKSGCSHHNSLLGILLLDSRATRLLLLSDCKQRFLF